MRKKKTHHNSILQKHPTTRGPHPHTIANSEIYTKQGQHLETEDRF
jgi:hypothetical protein